MALLDVKDLSFSFPQADYLWEHLNFSLEPASVTLLAGPNGSGKSTLLSHMVYKLAPHGQGTGRIVFRGKDLDTWDGKDLIQSIAYVGPNPDRQMVSESVWQELAFAPENLGMDPYTMRLRIADVCNFFGIEDWFWQKTSELSGGQKQILNLASALVLQPDLLILDEADAHLDPLMREQFWDTVKRLNEVLGLTVLLCSHNWSKVLPLISQVLYLEDKSIESFTSASAFASYLLENGSPLARALPAPSQASFILGTGSEKSFSEGLPLTFAQIRPLLDRFKTFQPESAIVDKDSPTKARMNRPNSKNSNINRPKNKALLQIKDLSFRYQKDRPLVLNRLNLTLDEGAFFFLLGSNGSGKSTLLKCILGALKFRGKILYKGKASKDTIRLAYLPQNAYLLFKEDTVLEEFTSRGLEEDRALSGLAALGLYDLKDLHPLDLSGGQAQSLALRLLILGEPDLLLLDEPSNNLSPQGRDNLARELGAYRKAGGTIFAVSHDLDFCAENATHVGLLFQGEISGVFSPQDFFSQNFFYTTDASRLAAYLDLEPDQTVTNADLMKKLEQAGHEKSKK